MRQAACHLSGKGKPVKGKLKKGRRDKLTLNHRYGVDACTECPLHAAGQQRLLFLSYRVRLMGSRLYQHGLRWIRHKLRHKQISVIFEQARSLSKKY